MEFLGYIVPKCQIFYKNYQFQSSQKPFGFGRVSQSGSGFFGFLFKSRVRVSVWKKQSRSGFCRVRPRPVTSLEDIYNYNFQLCCRPPWTQTLHGCYLLNNPSCHKRKGINKSGCNWHQVSLLSTKIIIIIIQCLSGTYQLPISYLSATYLLPICYLYITYQLEI